MMTEAVPQGYRLMERTCGSPSSTGRSLVGETRQAIGHDWHGPFSDLIHANTDVVRPVAYINADSEIQGLLAEINADDGSMSAFKGAYTAQKAAALKAHTFDREALGARGLQYEKLDQLVNELLLGLR
jgi:hypothetical protein